MCDLFSISRIFNIVIRASVDNSNFVFIITEGIALFLNKIIFLIIIFLQTKCRTSKWEVC